MSGDAEFLAGARARLQQLKALHDAGHLDAATFKKERRAVEQEISGRLLADPAPVAPEPATAKPSRRLLAGVTAFAHLSGMDVLRTMRGEPTIVFERRL